MIIFIITIIHIDSMQVERKRHPAIKKHFKKEIISMQTENACKKKSENYLKINKKKNNVHE